MPIRNLDEVFIPANRIRKEFPAPAMEELIASILDKGLLHPPVVESDGALLVGERRYRALAAIAERGQTYHCNGKFLRPGLIYTTDIRELSPVQRFEAELEENTVRLDITWQEKAQAVEALHALRQMQKTAATLPGLPTPDQTVRDTAVEVKGVPLQDITRREVEDIRADLMVATWLQNHPDDKSVADAKSRSEALKSIEIQLENEHRSALAKRFMAKRASATGHILQLADVNTVMLDTPAGLYDCIITDPPWGVGAHSWTNGGSDRRHTYADDMATFERIHQCLAVEGYRTTKPKAHIYIFCAHQQFALLSQMFRAAGWDVWPRPLIWYRGPQAGIAPRPEHGPKNTYECILYANKGDKRTLLLLPDVIVAAKASADPLAAAKPAAVYYELLCRSVLPGDEVLDPCCGSGPIIPAANALRCRATCYDISDEAIGYSSGRLNEVYVPPDMEKSRFRGGGLAVRRNGKSAVPPIGKSDDSHAA